jgi:HAD superfamily hydrolase (TIGR01549 family)
MYFLFDFDGTLVTTLRIDYNQLKSIICDKLNIISATPMIDAIYMHSSSPTDIFKIIDKYECDALLNSIPRESIIELYKNTSPRIIITRNGKSVVELFFKTYKLPLPDFISCRDNCRFMKPDICHLKHAISEFPLLVPSNIVMVGDSWHDEEVARNFGCNFMKA